MLRVILITPMVIALMGGAATLPAASKEVVQIYHINPKRNARTPLDEMANCLRDRVCYEVTSAAAAHFGVPPNALRVAKAAAILARAKGEETRYQITPPPGYKVCRVNIRTKSVVPANGDRASLFSLAAKPTGVHVYTWTPRRGLFKGRSWYDGYVTVYYSHVSRNCSVDKKGKRYLCRGNGRNRHGHQECGTADL